MVTLTSLIVLAVLGAIMVRGSLAGPLDIVERLYLVSAPIPAILALVLPAPMADLMRGRGDSRAWGLWLNQVGGWMSLILIVLGVALLYRRSMRHRAWDRRLLLGVSLAALPAVLIALVALMYAGWGSARPG